MAGMLHGWIADSPQLACRRSGERYIRPDIAMACRVRSHPIRITYNYRNIPLIVVIYQLVAVQPCWVYYLCSWFGLGLMGGRLVRKGRASVRQGNGDQ